MSSKFSYASYARYFATHYPISSRIIIQVYFWIVANLFIATVIHLVVLALREMYSLKNITGYYLPVIVLSITLGIFYGIAQGFMNVFFDKKAFRNKPLGKIILFKTLLSLVVFIIFFSLMRFVFYELIVIPYLLRSASPITGQSWAYIFYLLLIFYLFMTVLMNFINQVNNKYGPGVLLPLLLGKYRSPKEEERIFMFMDLTSSTMIAEKLGHIKYSEFIRDSFMDINHILRKYNAEIYQYVGDEVVITWMIDEGIENFSCLGFFFACEKEFKKRSPYYVKRFGFVPQFKAGLHMGKVTAVEIGEIKRDIAYHGDTLNTASRIQSLCNKYEKTLLASEYFVKESGLKNQFAVEFLDSVLLKGKVKPIGIVTISRN